VGPCVKFPRRLDKSDGPVYGEKSVLATCCWVNCTDSSMMEGLLAAVGSVPSQACLQAGYSVCLRAPKLVSDSTYKHHSKVFFS